VLGRRDDRISGEVAGALETLLRLGPRALPGRSRRVRLVGRGTTWIRELGDPGCGPTVVLLHGLGATADLNFAALYPALFGRFHVVAPDLRGHGKGIRTPEPFGLATCADDVVSLLDVLGVEHAVLLGYSMGGPIALLGARRHPMRVRGLVLCATAACFGRNEVGRALLKGVGLLGSAWLAVGLVPGGRRIVDATTRIPSPVPAVLRPVGPVLRSLPALPHFLVASGALGSFDARRWLRELAVPAVVVVTTRDRLVAPHEQRALAVGLPGGLVLEADGGHDLCARHPRRFARVVLEALDQVLAAPLVPRAARQGAGEHSA
jgi:3-oxoadipate enol-lactonase